MEKAGRNYFEDKKYLMIIFMGVLFLGMVCSVLRVKQGSMNAQIVHSYFAFLDEKEKVVMLCLGQWFHEFKKIALTWIGGIKMYLVPLVVLIQGIYFFAYGYTWMSLIIFIDIWVEWKKMIIMFLCSIFMLSYLLKEDEQIVRKYRDKKEGLDRKYSMLLGQGIIVSIILTFIQYIGTIIN